MEITSFSNVNKSELKDLSIRDVLSSISLEVWRKANWPVISYTSKGSFSQIYKDRILSETKPAQKFWEGVLDSERFFSSGNILCINSKWYLSSFFLMT